MSPSDLLSLLRRPRRRRLLAELQETWEDQARADPLWAVLSERSKLGRAWQLDKFLATGEQQVALWLQRIADRKVKIRTGRAVDFGCGIGRLTQALARRFDYTIGLDIAPTMLRIAREINPYHDKVEFILNVQDDLAVIETKSVDLVISHITLQHIKPEIGERYLREFFRILRPGGVMVFQLPSHLLLEEAPEGVPVQSQPRADSSNPISPEDSLADIRLIGGGLEMTVDQASIVRVSIENVSQATWQQSKSFPLNVGNHWLTADGQSILVHEDGRASMPAVVGPGQKVEIELRVLAPRKPGEYILEIDLVQEGLRWFQKTGSKTLRANVRVNPGSPGETVDSDLPYEFPGLIDDVFRAARPFEMHGIRKERVLEIVKELDGELIALDEDEAAWRSYGYYVRVAG
jgi:SAM-dependent methyltransferase